MISQSAAQLPRMSSGSWEMSLAITILIIYAALKGSNESWHFRKKSKFHGIHHSGGPGIISGASAGIRLFQVVLAIGFHQGTIHEEQSQVIRTTARMHLDKSLAVSTALPHSSRAKRWETR